MDFYTQNILNYLESKNINYIIASKFFSNIKRNVYGLDNWVEICPSIEVNQIHFSHSIKERRYIIVRKKIKQDFGLSNFCMQGFWATEASFRFIMVAYNIMNLFRFFALQSNKKAVLKTLRYHCFALGAWTVNHANKKVLKISLPVKKRPWMEGIFSKIHQNVPPFEFSNAQFRLIWPLVLNQKFLQKVVKMFA